jgi:hypothetical protein
MNSQVRWKRSARDRLADLWVEAVDRQAITDAANAVDDRLGRDPLGCGESRDAGRRILIEPPLVVFYRVDEQARKVTVLSVRRLPSHS